MNIKDIEVGHLAHNNVTGNTLLVCKDRQAVVIKSTYDIWVGTVYKINRDMSDPYTDLGKIGEYLIDHQDLS